MCEHENVDFVGTYSLVGHYKCNDCGEEIDPVEYAKMKGDLNVALIEYYTEHPERLKLMWRDHNSVKHLYSNA